MKSIVTGVVLPVKGIDMPMAGKWQHHLASMCVAGQYKVCSDFGLLGQPERIMNKNDPAERGLCTGQRRQWLIGLLAARSGEIHPCQQQPALFFLYNNALVLQQHCSTAAYDIVHQRYIGPVIMVAMYSIDRSERCHQCHIIVQTIHRPAFFRQVTSKEDSIQPPLHWTQQLDWKAPPVNVCYKKDAEAVKILGKSLQKYFLGNNMFSEGCHQHQQSK
ncbi:hypothetical protein D3C75_845180 [compost metagenome]